MANILRKKRLGRYHSSFSRLYKESAANYWKRFLKRLIAILLIASVIYFLLFSAVFKVKNIQVEGTTLIDQKSILDQMPVGENIFLYPVSHKIAYFSSIHPEIEEIKIFRGIPNSINIEITEYQPQLLWSRNGLTGYVNSKGIFFYRLEDIAKAVVAPKVSELVSGEIQIGEQVATEQLVLFVQNLKAGFDDIQAITFDHVELGSNSFDLTIKTKEGIDIFVSSDEDLSRQLYYLKTILEKRRDKVTKKIDIRIPRWAYVE